MHHYLIEGPAGSGKTTRAIELALEEDRKIIIIRNTVQTREVGFLPGLLDEKIEPFFAMYQPLFSKLSKTPLHILIQKKKIFFHCTSFLRGLTFDNCVVILDEAQNLTLHELETVLTRVGKNGKLIVVGDDDQMDIPEEESGYPEFSQAFKKVHDVTHIELTENFRSQLITDYYKSKNTMDTHVDFMR